VTSYTILRKQGSGSYVAIKEVPASTTSYSDTSVSGFGTTYTYEIQANAPGGTATSVPVTVTTPVICL
jgi:hypothetical protein